MNFLTILLYYFTLKIVDYLFLNIRKYLIERKKRKQELK